jgi:hypothetical protein
MFRIVPWKGLYCAAMAYLALATMGIFALSALDESLLNYREGKGAAQNVFISSLDSHLDCLAVSAEKGPAFSPWRHSLPRISMPPGLFSAGAGLLCAHLKSIAGASPKIIKNTMPLKLLI